MDGCVGIMTKPVVDDAQVEVHLPGVLGLELAFLQVDHDEAAELQMVEQQIDVEVAVADVQVDLAADEGEALAEFQQEAFELMQEFGFQLPLVEGLFEREEVEDVRILEGLLHQVGLRRRQSRSKLECLPLPTMGLGLGSS